MGLNPATNMKNQYRKSERHDHSYKWSQENKCGYFENNIELNRPESTRHNGSTGKSSDKGMRRRRRNTFPPSNQIPCDSGNHTRQNNRQSDKLFYHGLGYSIGYTKPTDNVFGNKECDKIKESSPQNRLKGCEDFCRHDCRYRIGSIMKPVDKIEQQCQYNNNYQ